MEPVMDFPTEQRNEFRKYAWDYFQFHAAQRLSTFNFFVVLSVLLTSAAMTTFQEKFYLPEGGAFLGVMLMALAFVFWKMDQRNQELIKNGTEALMFLDGTALPGVGGKAHPLDLFRRDEAHMMERKAKGHWHMSFRHCMNAIFGIFSCVGLGIVGVGIFLKMR